MSDRLRKLVEYGSYGKQTGRVAYVLNTSIMPKPAKGFEWAEDASFNAAEAVLADGNLKEVYRTAIAKGYAIVTA